MRYYEYRIGDTVLSLTSHRKEEHVIPADAIPLGTKVQIDISSHAYLPYKRILLSLQNRDIPSVVILILVANAFSIRRSKLHGGIIHLYPM